MDHLLRQAQGDPGGAGHGGGGNCPVYEAEPKYRWGKCTNTIDIKRRVACPWCGKETISKELQYTGQRKNLWEYRRAVVLRQWRGALWACAYDCFKDYGRELTHLPKVKLLGVYRFRPGKAEGISRTWYDEAPLHGYICQTAPGRSRKMWELSAPYGFCADYGKGYEAVGLEELAKSVFRYCCIGGLQSGCDLIKLLTACCFYPRQIEWLAKLRLESAVAKMKKSFAGTHKAHGNFCRCRRRSCSTSGRCAVRRMRP